MKQKITINSEKYNPTANEHAVVIFEKARFTVLTSRMIRMEWAEDAVFEDHASYVFVNRNLQVPEFSYSINARVLNIDTGDIQIRYICDDRPFSEDNLLVRFQCNGEQLSWHPGMKNTGNLGGTNRSLDWWEGDKLHEPHNERAYVMNEEPVQDGLLSRTGWNLFDDSRSCLFDSADFSFEQGTDSYWPWMLPRRAGNRFDWYFMGYGHRYRELLSDYVKISGRSTLLPKYAFGIWWSRYSIYSDEELLQLVDEFVQRGLPIDAIALDLEWHNAYIQEWLEGVVDQSGRGKGFHGYTWNKNLFPDPEKFYQQMHERGVHIGLNLHPAQGVQPFEDGYREMCLAMGKDPEKQEYIALDILDKNYCLNNLIYMHHPTDRMGNDFWWNDHIDGDMTKHPGLQNITWMNYVLGSDMAMRGKRPMVLHRWGGFGSQRYPAQFSGDVFSTWDTLAFEVKFAAQSANSCANYWTFDLGGHYPGPVEPELYTRWLQFGVFSAMLRTHCCKSPEAERLIWKYPDYYEKIMKQCYTERHELLPYIYTEARKTYDSGVGFIHSLYIDYPEDSRAYECSHEYMFGDNLLIAPVTKPGSPKSGTTCCNVYLPEGEWYDLSMGRLLRGNSVIEADYLLEEVPVFQKAGSIVPLLKHTAGINTAADILCLRIAPASDSMETGYRIYDDDGESRVYAENVNTALFNISASNRNNTLVLTLEKEGENLQCFDEIKKIQILLPGTVVPEEAMLNGKLIQKRSFSSSQMAALVEMDCPNLNQENTLTIKWSERTTKLLPNGIKGVIRRMEASYHLINEVWPATFPSEQIIHVMQSGRRMELFPDTTPVEVEEFQKSVQEACKAFAEQEKNVLVSTESRSRYAARLGICQDSEEMQSREANVREILKKITILLDQIDRILE